MKKHLQKMLFGALSIAVISAIGIGFYMHGSAYVSKKAKNSTSSQSSKKVADNEKNVMTAEQKKLFASIKETYQPDKQEKIAASLNEKKSADQYTLQNPLIVYNPFGTNTQSLYIYFNSETPTASLSYTVHVDDDAITDYSQTVYLPEDNTLQTEFQLIGLIPNAENEITLTRTDESGNNETSSFTYQMGSLYGSESLILESSKDTDASRLSNGLYVILGNDSTSMDFMYYYDNYGILRGEVPLIGYRSHRLVFDDTYVYFSISEKRIAKMNRLGQICDVYNLGKYSLHHDYVLDDDNNLLVLASDTTQDSVEDILLRINTSDSSITKLLDLGDLFADYKKSCTSSDDESLDWMHINTVQWMGDDSVLLSSRETSSILKITNISTDPTSLYIISDTAVWKDTAYSDFVYKKDGKFTIQGGQHSITYVTDDSLEDGQYYLYMYNNNIGISNSRPDFDWSSVGLKVSKAVGDSYHSYYYKYLVDENKHTFSLEDSFAVPYSGYVSSAQEIGSHILIDSGIPGVFGEYDKNHQLLQSFTMNTEKFIYRVYKYDFDHFYTNDVQ